MVEFKITFKMTDVQEHKNVTFCCWKQIKFPIRSKLEIIVYCLLNALDYSEVTAIKGSMEALGEEKSLFLFHHDNDSRPIACE